MRARAYTHTRKCVYTPTHAHAHTPHHTSTNTHTQNGNPDSQEDTDAVHFNQLEFESATDFLESYAMARGGTLSMAKSIGKIAVCG